MCIYFFQPHRYSHDGACTNFFTLCKMKSTQQSDFTINLSSPVKSIAWTDRTRGVSNEHASASLRPPSQCYCYQLYVKKHQDAQSRNETLHLEIINGMPRKGCLRHSQANLNGAQLFSYHAKPHMLYVVTQCSDISLSGLC